MSPEEYSEWRKTQAKEHAYWMKLVRDRRRKFEGLTLEAILYSFIRNAYLDWDNAAHDARLFQWDSEIEAATGPSGQVEASRRKSI